MSLENVFDESRGCRESKVNRFFSFKIGGESPYKLNTNQFFFHSRGFLANQNVISFYILDNKMNVCEGLMHIAIQEEIGYSPLRAPFGSLVVNKTIAPSILNEFLEIIIDWCRENGLKALKIKHYPNCYDPEGSVLIQNALFNNGFLLTNSDIGQYIEVDPASQEFSRSARIKINKCKKAGFRFERLRISKIREVFDLLKRCKDRKGYPTNMNLEELEDLVHRFPGHYLIFGVTDDEKLISASICVVVNSEILYDFSHGHVWEYGKFSPVTLLVEGIINYCRQEKYQILDLGLSTENSVINNGLYDFKSRLGSRASLKFTYTRKLNTK